MKLIVIFSFLAISGFFQNGNDINKIEFSSVTRGHQEFVIITRDSIKVVVNKEKPKARLLDKKEWGAIVNSVKKLDLSSVSSLKSPTMKRAYDGAYHSTITLTTSSQSYSHSFDNENPHDKLKPLLKIILDKKKKLSAK